MGTPNTTCGTLGQGPPARQLIPPPTGTHGMRHAALWVHEKTGPQAAQLPPLVTQSDSALVSWPRTRQDGLRRQSPLE